MSSAHVFVTSAICLILATVGVSGQTPAGGLSLERVFGPEVTTGPYKHPACLTELANGDLYLVYYGGQGEYARDTAVFGSRLAKGSRAWTPPQAIASDPFRSLGNGVVWQAPDGLVWLYSEEPCAVWLPFSEICGQVASAADAWRRRRRIATKHWPGWM